MNKEDKHSDEYWEDKPKDTPEAWEEMRRRWKASGRKHDLNDIAWLCSTCGEVRKNHEEDQRICAAHKEKGRLEGEAWLAKRRADPDHVELTEEEFIERLNKYGLG